MKNFKKNKKKGGELRALHVGREYLAIDLEAIDIVREPAGVDTYWCETLDGVQICKFLDFLSRAGGKKVRKYYSEIDKLDFWGIQKDGSKKRYRIRNLPGNIVKFDGKSYEIPENLNIS